MGFLGVKLEKNSMYPNSETYQQRWGKENTISSVSQLGGFNDVGFLLINMTC